MDIQTAILQRRTIRRFENRSISTDQLAKLAEVSRFYASGGNLQPIRFIGIHEETIRDKVFEVLRWAAYLPGFELLPEDRPMAYMVLTCDQGKRNSCQFDLGAAATTLMLAAEGEGISTCCLGAFDHKKLSEVLELSPDVEPLLVIAMGYPAQKSRAVDYCGDIKYYEEAENALCVPKFTLEQVFEMK